MAPEASGTILKIGPPDRWIEVEGESLYLGRDSMLVLSVKALVNQVVSKRHCALFKDNTGRWFLEDLGSRNGTWVRGTRIFGRIPIYNKDTFSLGRNGPLCECWKGFGGAGPEVTAAEDEMTSAPTLIQRTSARVITDDGRDGSAERPYRAGVTPEVVLRHERTNEEFRAKGHSITIGRDPSAAQIVIRSDDQKHVSSRHCEIQFESGTVVLRDLNSRNGTMLNGRPVKGDVVVKTGDKIILGQSETTLYVVRLFGG